MEIKNLSKAYGQKTIFDQANFYFEKNKINIIMGESGSGKTSLLRILLGVEDYEGDLGSVENLEKSVVFQEDRLLEKRTVRENFYFVNERKKDREIYSALEALGLEDIIDEKVFRLSGGMKRRIAILRALSVDYDLLIMDEPFKGLDQKNYEISKKYVKEKTRGKTVIMTSHMKEDLDLLNGRLIKL